MVQQKMYCAVRGTYSNNQNDGGKFYSLKKSLEKNNFRASLEDSEISSLNSSNSDKRCAVLTVFTPEPVGLWRVVAVPPECLDHTDQLRPVGQVNMDGLCLVSPSSINSFKVDRRKAHKGRANNGTYPFKSFPARSFQGSDVQQQYRNSTLAHKVTKLNEFSSNSSSQSSITCSDFSAAIQQRSFKSSNIFIDNSKVDKNVKRNSRNKARKKGKQNKRFSSDSVSTEPEVLSEDYAPGISRSESGNNDVDHDDRLVSYAASQEDSSSDSRVNIKHVDDNNNEIITCCGSPKTCTSYIDEVDSAEAKVSSINFPVGHPLTDSNMMIEMEDQGSIIDGAIEGTHNLHIGCYDGIRSNGFSDMHDCRVLDSVSIGSNSDNSTSTRSDAKAYDREKNKFSYSEPPDLSSGRGCFSPQNLLSGVVDFYDYGEGMRYGNQRYKSSNMQVDVPGKRSKKAKMVPRSSSAHKHRNARHSHVHNHRVWQKVQKNDVDECKSEFKKVSPVSSKSHVTQKEPSSVRRNSSVAVVGMPSKSEDKKQLKDKVSKKLKRKTSPDSKQEYNYYSQRACNSSKASPNTCAKIGVQQNEILDFSTQVNDQKRLSTFPCSRSEICSPELGFQRSTVGSLDSESFPTLQDSLENLESTEIVSKTVSAVKHQQDSSLGKSCSLELNMLEVPSPVYLPHLIINQSAQTEKDLSLTEYGKQNHNSGSLLQKWIPIGSKDPQSTTSASCSSLSLGQSDRQGAEEWTLRNNVDEKATSHGQNPISSLNVGMMSMGLGSQINSLREDENSTLMLRNMNAHMIKEKNNKHVAADCLISESKDPNFAAIETDLKKIAQAVNDASRMQLASEAIQMATGGPMAEFERFLHLSSPIICHSPTLISRKNCSQEHGVGGSLCRYDIPNVPLGCLWQWYEGHGSYGLEVRAEDYEQSNRLGVDRFSFRAYFVPFLSAVQLFKDCRNHPANNGHAFPTARVSKNHEISEKLQSSSNVGHLPIFSVLVPRPRTLDASALPPVKEVCKSELSPVSDGEDLSVPSVDMMQSDDVELLFEYFESEQPRQRRPLHEKICELVGGDGLSHCQVYGDPTNLNAINLHDLHPTSWYSVAWYPIYRIPDGSFRAAFLTYHSLGHMVQRSAKVDSANAEACIVSPAVGLQSYNAQSECWFQLRQSAFNHTAESEGLNPSRILKEHLRTLEKTASVMSRAVVNKGNQVSVNRHSDYEFFLSRRSS